MSLHIELAPQHKSGLYLRNPVIMASGTFGYGVEYARIAEIHRLGAIVCNSISLHARDGVAQSGLQEAAAGLLSSFERPDPGVHKVLKKYSSLWASWQTPVIANLAGTSCEEFAELAARLEGSPGIAALEINLACPNSAADGVSFGSDPGAVEQLIGDVREQTTLPLIAKLAPFDGDLRSIAMAAVSSGADALSLVHSFPGLSIDPDTRRPLLSGGLCGPAIKPLALRQVYNIACELRSNLSLVPLIGIGGISNTNDALEFLMAGASAIQVGTINFVNPRTGIEILEGLEAFMQREGVVEISELIGAALP